MQDRIIIRYSKFLLFSLRGKISEVNLVTTDSTGLRFHGCLSDRFHSVISSMVTIFAIIIVSILVGIIFKQRMDAEKKEKGSGA